MPTLRLKSDHAPRFLLLLVSIIGELMIAPFLMQTDYGLHVMQVLVCMVLVAALWAAGAQRTGIILFVPTIAAHLIAAYGGNETMRLVAILLRIAFLAYTTGIIMWRTLRQADVTLDTIAGAACAYTLLALVWTSLYRLLELIQPGSFNIPLNWHTPTADPTGAALAYFSFVTLTTVGYGDITPTWPGAGGLAAAEALVGQLYLAITIARLVGLHTSRGR